MVSNAGVKKVSFGMTTMSFNLLMSSSRNDNEPFIFAWVAGQVFYVQDNLNTDWHIVIEIKPRDIFANQEDNLGGMNVAVEVRSVNEIQNVLMEVLIDDASLFQAVESGGIRLIFICKTCILFLLLLLRTVWI